MMMTIWHYERQGVPQGPVTASDLLALVRSGEVPPDALVWREGMAGWGPLRDTEVWSELGPLPGHGIPASAPSVATGGPTPPAPPVAPVSSFSTLQKAVAGISVPLAVCGIILVKNYAKIFVPHPAPPAAASASPSPSPAAPAPTAYATWFLDDDPAVRLAVLSAYPAGSRNVPGAATLVVRRRPMPWLSQGTLLWVQDSAWSDPRRAHFFVRDRTGRLSRLDGTSAPVHAMNAAGPMSVTSESVLPYLRFFTYFVRGPEGPFLIVEGEDQRALDKPLDDASAAKLRAVAKPARCVPRAVGAFDCKAVVYYSNALFEADFRVLPTGVVEMSGDNPVAANLSSRPYQPID